MFAWHPLIREPIGDVLLQPRRQLRPLSGGENQDTRRAARWKRIDLAACDSKGRQRDRLHHDLHDAGAAVFGHLTDKNERQVLLLRLDQSEPARSP